VCERERECPSVASLPSSTPPPPSLLHTRDRSLPLSSAAPSSLHTAIAVAVSEEDGEGGACVCVGCRVQMLRAEDLVLKV
jgi:hypothetical protein